MHATVCYTQIEHITCTVNTAKHMYAYIHGFVLQMGPLSIGFVRFFVRSVAQKQNVECENIVGKTIERNETKRNETQSSG